MVKRIFRIILISIGTILCSVILFILLSLKKIDRTPYQQQAHYQRMIAQLDSLSGRVIPKPASSFKTGFGKVNITPDFPMATAGYGNRRGKEFTTVHDSIFIRAMVFSNGAEKVAIVSADLLIIPPKVTEILNPKLQTIGFSLNNTYLNAVHTHNSIGNWGEGATGFIYGSYSDSIVAFIADKIVESVRRADAVLLPSQIKVGSTHVGSAIRNRLDKTNGKVDSLLHAVEIVRDDKSNAILLSFNAHATCLFSKDLELSRDYPGALVDSLEAQGYSFAMFLAGAVGSHGCRPPEYGKPCLGWMADEISKEYFTIQPTLRRMRDSTITMVRVPLHLGEPQVKVSENWRVRPWLFNSAFGEYQSYLTALRIGDILLLGTPCDFSGELTGAIHEAGLRKGLHTIVTSFNGHYIGYITSDIYYDTDHYETRLMNWYGPGNGAYLTECLIKLQEAVD